MFYYIRKSRPETHLKEEPKTRGSPRDPPEDSTPWPIPKVALRPAAQAKGTISSSTGSVSPSLVPRRWKTPWNCVTHRRRPMSGKADAASPCGTRAGTTSR